VTENFPSTDAWRILRSALDLPDEQRDDFVRSACADDAALFREVTELLRIERDPDSLLDHALPIRDELGVVDEAPVLAEVGGYRLLDELGRGGMGAVYRAERIGGVAQHRVALKIIKRGMDSDDIVRRFVRERDILAQLKHQNIARLIDGGVGADGRVWFAMELIDGAPITTWCDAHRATLEARLRLFCAVCGAVQYAHRNLVVHRDLKPSNILVSTDGDVKLLDFGIAKLLDERSASDNTGSQVKLMTPEFAAPEQLRGESVTTATDIYQLGLVLYEILCGHRAKSRSTGGDSSGRFRPMIAALDESGPPLSPENVAEFRSTAVGALRRALSGDLARIVRKALSSEPSQRYETAASLADDIRRFLGGMPVLARPDSLLYRTRKFVGRHALGIGMAALVIAALMAATVYSLQQARRAEAQAHRAEVVRGFLLDLFELNNPDLRRGAPLSVNELVDLGARRAESGLNDDSETRVELLGVVGNLYIALGNLDQAKLILEKRLAAATTLFPPHDSRLARAKIDMASLAEHANDRSGAAIALVEQAMADLGADRTDTRDDRADALGIWSALEALQGHHAKALELGTQEIELLKRTGAPATRQASALSEFANHAFGSGDVALANDAVTQALALLEHLPDSDPVVLIGVQFDLAEILVERGRFDEAAKLLDTNLPLLKQIYGEAHPTIALNLFERAQLERMRGAPAVAIPYYRSALAMYEKTFGADSTNVAATLTSLGQALDQSGKKDEAIEMLERANAAYIKQTGFNSRYSAISTTALAKAHLSAGDAVKAEQGYREALAKYEALGNAHDIYAEAARAGLGEALTAQRRFAEAEPMLRKANDALAKEFGVGDFRAVGAAIVLARCLAGEDRKTEAQAVLEETRQKLAEQPADKAAVLLGRIDKAREELIDKSSH
jgi:serine/threonine-protein kinase